MKHKILLSVLFLASCQQILTGQSNIQFENINTNNGLAASHVNQIIQDKEGFIWVATTDGLSRFDGVDFKNFQHNPKNIKSLSSNNIRCVFEDSRGYIWAGTLNSGLNRYDYNTGTFTHFVFDEKQKNSISDDAILSFFEDSKGRFWIGTESGLNLFDYETATFTRFLPDEKSDKSISAGAVLTIAEDHRGWLWFGTWNGGLNLLIPTKNPKVFEFRHFLKGNEATELKSNHVWKIFLDKENRLWLGMYDGGLSVLLPNEETNPKKINPLFQTFFREENNQLASNVIFGLNQDEFGQIWVATVDGLTIFTPQTIKNNNEIKYKIIKAKNYKNSFTSSMSLVSDEMREIFIDKEGIVWCATTGGISKYDKNSANFSHFLPNINSEINKMTTAIIEYNKDIVYIAGHPEFGLIEFNQKTQATQLYYLDGEKNSPYKTGLTCFYKKSEDSLWIGSRTGIVYFNPKTKRFKNYELRRPNGDFCQVKKIIYDKRGHFWLGTNQGLILFNEYTETVKFIDTDSKGISLKESDISDILFDKEHRLWLATYGGLTRITFRKDGNFFFKNYRTNLNDPNSICSNRVMNLVLINDEIWAGTEDGLSHYNSKTDNFKNFKSGNGLKNSNIVSMVVGNDNRLWLGTRQGLIVFDTQTHDVIHYNQKDGIITSIFMVNSANKSQDGTLYFGSTNGYIRFKSKNIKSNKKIPPVRITDITVFNKFHILDKDASVLEEITLQPNENYFTVKFAALNFTQSSDNQYAYKLEGFNKDWVYCGNQKSVSFSNLDGGTYILRIKGSNNDGLWNEEGISLKINVIPPLWQRFSFRLILALFIIGISLLFYFSRIKSIANQNARLENEVQTRTEKIRSQKLEIEGLVKELKNQNNHLEIIVKERTKTLERSNLELMRSNKDLEQFAYVASHDLQEPLRTIGSFTQILARKYKDEIDTDGQLYMANIVDGVKRMSELIKSLLNYSRLGRDDVQFSLENPQDILKDKIVDLSVKIREKNAQIIIGKMPEKILCEPNQIGVVFYNLINNGIKFNTNPNPQIIVQLENEDKDYWTFSVADNGIGIDMIYKEKVFEIFQRLNHVSKFEGTGIGLAFCKRIILRHEGDIWFESTLGEGTTFYFTIHKHIKQDVIGEYRGL